ncbi:4257_t:CDS:2, partial [Dentiscutata erythropus]
IRVAIHYTYKQATTLAKDVLGMMINTQICGLTTISKDKKDLEIENEIKSTNLQKVKSLQENKSIFISVAVTEVNNWNKLDALTEKAVIYFYLISNKSAEINIDIGVVNEMFELFVLINNVIAMKPILAKE